MKQKFIVTKLDQCKSDLKQTLKIIYEVLGKNKKDTTSDAFIIDGDTTHDFNIVAAGINEFFLSTLGTPTRTRTKNSSNHISWTCRLLILHSERSQLKRQYASYTNLKTNIAVVMMEFYCTLENSPT